MYRVSLRYAGGGEPMARVPDVAHRRFFSGTPLDILILISFNSGVFYVSYTIAPLRKVWVQITPTKPRVRRAAIFALKTGENQKKKVSTSVELAHCFPPKIERRPKQEAFTSAEPLSPQFI